jgi:hypothetical protein
VLSEGTMVVNVAGDMVMRVEVKVRVYVGYGIK